MLAQWGETPPEHLSGPDIGLGDKLFDLVVEEFGIHKTLCSELYYEGKTLYGLPPKS
jgi:hypothetical protein